MKGSVSRRSIRIMTLGVAMLLDGYVEPMLYGAIVGAIYKPAARPVGHRAAV